MKLKFLAPLLLPLALVACSNTYPDASSTQFKDMVSVEQTWEGKRLTGPTITLPPEAGTTTALFKADAYIYGRESSNEKHQIDTRVNLLVKHTDFGFEYGFVSINGLESVKIQQERATFRTCDELCVFDQMFSFSIPESVNKNADLVIQLQEKANSKHGPVLSLPGTYMTGYEQVQIENKIENEAKQSL
jgi:hypothetical protein